MRGQEGAQDWPSTGVREAHCSGWVPLSSWALHHTLPLSAGLRLAPRGPGVVTEPVLVPMKCRLSLPLNSSCIAGFLRIRCINRFSSCSVPKNCLIQLMTGKFFILKGYLKRIVSKVCFKMKALFKDHEMIRKSYTFWNFLSSFFPFLGSWL